MKAWILLLLLWASLAFAQKKDLDAVGLPCPCDVVHHAGYSLCYSEPDEQAKWVAYRLTRDEILDRAVETTSSYFRKDTSIATGSAAKNDYTNSNYSRGHLAPKADMRWSMQAYKESFLMSNISPQEQSFNNGVWGNLEDWQREKAKELNSLYIVVGPVLKGNLRKLPNTQVSIPEYFYKVILYKNGSKSKAIGFVMAAEDTDEPFENFAVSVDSVESLTGFDFFNKLPDTTEKAIEKTVDSAWWFAEEE